MPRVLEGGTTMAKAKRSWTVTKHGPLRKIDENLWVVEGNVPGVPIKRRMCIVRMNDGSLVFFHAIPVDDATLEQIKALGKPAYLVVGHDQHAIDAHAFREKLQLEAYGPKACEAKLRERFELAGTLESFPSDGTVTVESVPGTKHGETIMTVQSGDRSTLLFADVIQNSPKESTSLIFRLLGFSGGPKVVWVFRRLFVQDRAALKAALEKWASLPGLRRIVPFHGAIVEEGASSALSAAAASL
jgi:hypothetical protein